MNVLVWVLQIVLAVAFGLAGVMKATQPKERLRQNLPWVEDYSAGTVRLIGVLELLGAVGLVLPAAAGVATVLTPLAATGLAIVMLLAMDVHRRRHESSAIAINAVLLVLAVVVAVARFGPYSL